MSEEKGHELNKGARVEIVTVRNTEQPQDENGFDGTDSEAF